MEDMLPLVEESEEVKSLVKMCDKKNYVLFTDTACFVLSPDFKLPDESQNLLKVPRKKNMYSVDMKNIVPKESLTCLVAKGTFDESILWHMRLGHVKFKTINKLVKDNLVRVLPSKHFENDQTCVACLKRKQHKASCIKREYSIARTPQQNYVAERRNRTLIEAVRTMLADSKLPTTFWAEAVNTACYVQNRVIIVKPYNKTPYELFRGSEVSIGEGTTSKETDTSQDYIVMPLWKDSSLFDSPSMNVSHDEPEPSCDAEKKDDEGVSKASGVDDQERPESSTPNINTAGPSINTASANLRTGSLHINTVSPTVLTTRSNRPQTVSDIFSLRDNVTPEATNVDLFGDETEMDMSNLNASYQVPTTPNTRIHKDHSLDHVIGDIQSGVQTRGMTKTANEQGFLSAAYERKPHENLNTSRIEAKRLFLAYASFMGFMVYQMDVKSAFLYAQIEEEVYVCQPLGFEDPDYPDKVYKVVKELYGLYQTPRAWYETLAKYLLDNGFCWIPY
ncbi:putative ribonuclease H-like domain-containing protein [Tanacetum coccineum]